MRKKTGVSSLGKLLTSGLSFALAVAANCAHMTPAMASEPINIPGTTVTMTPPEGFVLATNFSGFVSLEKQGSLLVAELPAEAIGQLSRLFNDREAAAKGFSTKGITVTERQEIAAVDGEVIPLLHGTQEANGTLLDKWMALYGGERTVLITLQVPHEKALEAQVVKTVFASVSTGKTQPLDEKLSVLPFKIEVVEPFRITDTFGGSAVSLTTGDKDIDPEGLQPMIIVAISQQNGDMSDLAVVSERALKQTTSFESAEVTVRKETTFAGVNGYLLQGTCVEKGVKKGFVQYLGVRGARVLRLIGSADEKKFFMLEDKIEKIAVSTAFRE